jgi:ribosomal protein S18 acetylase RimI-like enzyme
MTATPPSTDPIDIESPAVSVDELPVRAARARLAVRVRAYTASDWRAVEALVVAQLEQEFIALRLEDRQLLTELEHDYGRETLLVAVSQEEQTAGVVGVIALKADGPRIGRIQVLNVSPDERRRGVATALLREALADASARGFDDVIVDAPRRGDAGASAFLDATGFRLMAVTLHTSIYSRGVEEPLPLR